MYSGVLERNKLGLSLRHFYLENTLAKLDLASCRVDDEARHFVSTSRQKTFVVIIYRR